MKALNINWRKMLVEMMGIVFAVLLALALEGWREDVEQEEKTEAYLDRIRQEISENRENLIEAIADNQVNIDGIQAAVDEGEVSIRTVGQFLQISAGSTSDAAWMSAQMTQSIGRMHLETVEDLTGLYDTQSYYTSYVRAFFQQYTDLAIGVQRADDEGWSARKFLQHLRITNSLAEQVIEGYDDFLKMDSDTSSK